MPSKRETYRPWLIISGGQTGADQGALEGALDVGIPTGGWIPRGWLTENGPDPSLIRFGLKEHHSDKYPRRTVANVAWGDATLIVGTARGAGSALTIKLCWNLHKNFHIARWNYLNPEATNPYFAIKWLEAVKPKVLNVAGNRESNNPGVQAATRQLIRDLFQV